MRLEEVQGPWEPSGGHLTQPGAKGLLEGSPVGPNSILVTALPEMELRPELLQKHCGLAGPGGD